MTQSQRDTPAVRLLAVIGGELMGADERRDWALLEALVAANGPAPITVRVLALVHQPPRVSIVFGNPLSRAVGGRAAAGSGARPGPIGALGRYNPAESARQRLDRAVQYLRALGLRASGDIEPGDPFAAVRRETARGGYDRVVVLAPPPPWPRRVLGRGLVPRLRRALTIPVDAPS